MHGRNRKPDGGERQVTYFLGGCWTTPMFPQGVGFGGGGGGGVPIGDRLVVLETSPAHSHPGRNSLALSFSLSTPRRKEHEHHSNKVGGGTVRVIGAWWWVCVGVVVVVVVGGGQVLFLSLTPPPLPPMLRRRHPLFSFRRPCSSVGVILVIVVIVGSQFRFYKVIQLKRSDVKRRQCGRRGWTVHDGSGRGFTKRPASPVRWFLSRAGGSSPGSPSSSTSSCRSWSPLRCLACRSWLQCVFGVGRE